MKKRIVCVMLTGMLMSVSLSACAGKTVDSVGGENTEVEDAAEVLTDALVAAVKNADADALDITERGFFVGAPSGKPGVTFGYDAEGNLGITGINY